MSDSIELPVKREKGRKILFAIAWLAVVGWFAWLTWNMVSTNALVQYERQWEAKGEHFAFADFIPPPVPDDQNFALTPVVASSYEESLDKTGHLQNPKNTNVINRLGMNVFEWRSLAIRPTNIFSDWAQGIPTDLKAYQAYYRALAAKTNEFPVPAVPQSPAADVLLALSKYDGTIEELRQAAALPDSRFPLNYDAELPTDILLPHLGGLKDSCAVLSLRAVAELNNGQSDFALADVKLMLRLAASIRSEPFLISHLVRIAMIQLALQPVWEGILEHHWTDVQLDQLNHEFSGVDFLTDYESCMRGERAVEMADIQYMQRTRDPWVLSNDGDNDASGDVVSKSVLRLIPSSVFYQNELSIARGFQTWLLPVVNVPHHSVSPDLAQQAEANIEKQHFHWSFDSILAMMLLPPVAASCVRFAHAQSSVDMAQVACALERFRLARGEYPATLDALVPTYIESLPPDVIGGQPLKYHRTANGQFALYSVGWNGVDDGGKVVFKQRYSTYPDYREGDWVWSGQVLER